MGVNAVPWLPHSPSLKECVGRRHDAPRRRPGPLVPRLLHVGINRWRFLTLNSCLFVIRGQPADVFPRLFKEWNMTKLPVECHSEPFGKEGDAAIKKLATAAGAEVIARMSRTLYDLDKIMELNGGQPPLTYKRIQTLISKVEPLEIPAGLVTKTITSEGIEKCTTPLSDDHNHKYGVSSLEELGFDTDGLSSAVWPGGETEALTHLERHLERKAWVVKKSSSLPLSLYEQLLWREFFYTAATNNPRFDKMKGNPLCVQSPWDKSSQALAKWTEGGTGFPWIDAIMTQLPQEGWIRHLASWEEGMKVFEELFLDANWSINAGIWMWLSRSSFFQQFFHCYCPVGFGRRTDPSGDYIRCYLPVLRGFPAKYICDPWNAPEGIQKVAKCLIGVNYPKLVVKHAEASHLNIKRMKQIYQQLSQYRGPGLLASVPSNPNRNGSFMGYSAENIPGCSSNGSFSQGSGILHCAHGDIQQTHLLKQGRSSMSTGLSGGKHPSQEEDTQRHQVHKIQRRS
uniref:Cryptochrome-1 n=1 Tax=Saimiri boliviensis boliviensis TaxID=39432 RepID=A0A2K6RYT2_SAIBB